MYFFFFEKIGFYLFNFYWFLKRNKNDEQKREIESIKKTFLIQILPILDLFYPISPIKSFISTEKEHNMDENYFQLLNRLFQIFEKYGYKKIFPGMFHF